MLRRIGVSIFVTALAAASCAAQESWEKKDYRQWSIQECQRVLKHSPWAQTFDVAAPVMIAVAGTGSDATAEVSYVVQFRTAPAVRKAVVRQALIQAKIDKLPSDRAKAAEAQGQQFVDQPSPDVVLVHVMYGTNIDQLDRNLANYWQHQTLDTIRNSIALLGPRGRIEPIGFQLPPDGTREFELVFPRKVDGAPILNASDKSIGFELQHPGSLGNAGPNPLSRSASTANNPTRVFVEFKVKEMTVDGNVVY